MFEEDGRSTCRSYTPAMRMGSSPRLAIEAKLRRALERSEFTLNYPPLVSLTDHRIIDFEVLIRWRRPSGRRACHPATSSSRSPKARSWG